jgi:uncharacterized protein YbcC (UPF0753/DUF2309 family)
MARWRREARTVAQQILINLKKEGPQQQQPSSIAEQIIGENLNHLGIPQDEWNQCVLSMLLKTKGWAGMFAHMEHHPRDAPHGVPVSLLEFCAVQSIISRAAIRWVAQKHGWDDNFMTLSQWLARAPRIRNIHSYQNVKDISIIAHDNQAAERIQQLEKEFQVGLLSTLCEPLPAPQLPLEKETSTTPLITTDSKRSQRPDIQFLFCIDDRMCSIRRHVEQASATVHVETFGVPGYFGLPVTFNALDSHRVVEQAPAGVSTVGNVQEVEDPKFPGEVTRYNRGLRYSGKLAVAFEKLSFSPVGSIMLSFLVPLSWPRLFLMSYSPLTLDSIRTRMMNVLAPKPHTDFMTDINPKMAASLLAKIFKSTGILKKFAPLVSVVGHGASSVNNPFSSAYNCGACSGNRGGVNARLFALLANNAVVREYLSEEHGVCIPNDTVFLGAQHDTTSDNIEYYDEEDFPLLSHECYLRSLKEILEKAVGENALERCHRFLLAEKSVRTAAEARKFVRRRAVDFAEIRPELNHATNAAVIVGRRSLTRGKFLDRRAFLPSYDPFSDDDTGTLLEYVLAPALTVCSGINLEYYFSTIANDRHGAGTKAPLNVVANLGVQQGTYGDLRTGLPSQMVEMHIPIRALYFVDAPPERVEAVLTRRQDLSNLVKNGWVRMFVRDPRSGQLFENEKSTTRFIPLPLEDNVQSTKRITQQSVGDALAIQIQHGLEAKHREDRSYALASIAMMASLIGPWAAFNESIMMNPHGFLVATCGTSLALPVLAFSRRYLHGEFMFNRFAFLSCGLLLGFNTVAMAPGFPELVEGWGLFGFASAFLISSYNDRPSVRNNATYAFAAYRISDFALLSALAFTSDHVPSFGQHDEKIVAGCLLLAALFKSSQFPLTSLFARSMEGPTPTSALGYGGLSAHVGIVLLASTTELWFPYDWARLTLAGCGAFTALYGGLLSKIHADRKGALAYATSATLGLLYGVMAAGYTDVALALAMGHASFRTMQVLTAPDAIDNSKRRAGALGYATWPKRVPDWLFRSAWFFHRLDTDVHLVNVLHSMYSPLHTTWNLSPFQQYLTTGLGLVVAGFPFTPLANGLEHWIVDLLHTNPGAAMAVMATHFGVSVFTMRFLLLSVLKNNRLVFGQGKRSFPYDKPRDF